MKQPLLLIVDDEQDIKSLYKTIINKHFDFRILEADSLAAVQKIIQSEIPDFVLLDLKLGDGNGFDVIPALKKINPQVKILVISAFNHCKEKQKATDLGAVGLLAKPFEKEIFIQHLHQMNNL